MSGEDLAARTCTPCQGGIPPMSEAQARGHMDEVPGWELTGDAAWLKRTFRFNNFREAFDLVRKVHDIAEAEGHHPDVCFGFGYATVTVQTHKIGGLHENDFILAAKINDAAGV